MPDGVNQGDPIIRLFFFIMAKLCFRQCCSTIQGVFDSRLHFLLAADFKIQMLLLLLKRFFLGPDRSLINLI